MRDVTRCSKSSEETKLTENYTLILLVIYNYANYANPHCTRYYKKYLRTSMVSCLNLFIKSSMVEIASSTSVALSRSFLAISKMFS